MADVRFSALAYSKMIIHSAKYPHCAVNGILLSEDLQNKTDKKDKGLVILDAVPLFHLCLHVSPMAEIALTQIDHWASGKGLSIAGYYLANENLKDTSYDKAGYRIAEKIAENCNSACLVVIDNSQLTLNMEDTALCVYQFVDNKWKPRDRSSVILDDDCLNITAAFLQRRQFDIVDFDCHLDDIRQDWRNPNFNLLVERETG